jgi:hypothetical protein
MPKMKRRIAVELREIKPKNKIVVSDGTPHCEHDYHVTTHALVVEFFHRINWLDRISEQLRCRFRAITWKEHHAFHSRHSDSAETANVNLLRSGTNVLNPRVPGRNPSQTSDSSDIFERMPTGYGYLDRIAGLAPQLRESLDALTAEWSPEVVPVTVAGGGLANALVEHFEQLPKVTVKSVLELCEQALGDGSAEDAGR